jgi:hypothetical protein
LPLLLSCVAAPQSSEPLRLSISIVRTSPVAAIKVGSQTVPVGIDTGGGAIALSEDVIRNAGGVKLAEELEWSDAYGQKYRVPQFKVPVITIGGRAFRDIVVIQATESRDSEGPPVPNAIGGQFLSQFVTVIDYVGQAFTLWPPGAESEISAACGTTRVPMEKTEQLDLAVSAFNTPSGTLRLLWDTGASYSMLPEALAANRRLETFLRGQTPFFNSTTLSVAGREFGPLEFVVPPLQLPSDFEGMLGANFFSSHVVCLDYEKREVRIR